MKKARTKTTKSLKCERPGCGHSWDDHEHSTSPVPKAEELSESCLRLKCACRGYAGLGPASLRRGA